MIVEPSGLSLSDWNWAVLMLNQALLGAISPNFVQVALAFENAQWVVRVTLREDDETDREAISDVCGDFESSLSDVRDRIDLRAYAHIVSDVIISTQPLDHGGGMEPRLVFSARWTKPPAA